MSPEFSHLVSRLLDKSPASRMGWRELSGHAPPPPRAQSDSCHGDPPRGNRLASGDFSFYPTYLTQRQHPRQLNAGFPDRQRYAADTVPRPRHGCCLLLAPPRRHLLPSPMTQALLVLLRRRRSTLPGSDARPSAYPGRQGASWTSPSASPCHPGSRGSPGLHAGGDTALQLSH